MCLSSCPLFNGTPCLIFYKSQRLLLERNSPTYISSDISTLLEPPVPISEPDKMFVPISVSTVSMRGGVYVFFFSILMCLLMINIYFPII